MRRAIVNVISIILAFVLQTAVFPFIPYVSISPNLLIIITFSLAFVYGEKEGIIYGVLCGLLLDFYYPSPLGLYTLIFAVIGYLNGLFSKYYYDNYILLPILLCVVNEMIFNLYLFLYRMLVRSGADITFFLKKIMLPEMVLTLLFTLVLYRAILGYNNALAKIDEREKKKRMNA